MFFGRLHAGHKCTRSIGVRSEEAWHKVKSLSWHLQMPAPEDFGLEASADTRARDTSSCCAVPVVFAGGESNVSLFGARKR